MGREITRRDLLNGMGIALSGSVLFPWARIEGMAPNAVPYPPVVTGLRGSHPGSFEVAHAMRDGMRWPDNVVEDSGESYDLVVVGGGLSGLSAAWFYRQKVGPEARILILDNHDDFGGHAKRNEFHQQNRMLLGHGGTINIEDFDQYGRAARKLFRSLGINARRYDDYADRDLFESLGMRSGVFFDREIFGADRLVVEREGESWAEFFARTPLSKDAQKSLVELYEKQIDYLPDLSLKEKRDFLRKSLLSGVSTRNGRRTPRCNSLSFDKRVLLGDRNRRPLGLGGPLERISGTRWPRVPGSGGWCLFHLPRWQRLDRTAIGTVADPGCWATQ